MSSYIEYKEEPIPLVVYNEEKRMYEMGEDVGEFLKKIPGPIGIISVAGMYRTGKSYLLNRMLLNRSGGFGVGPTINPCTKGMWVWGKPIPGFTPEGDPISVLVVDTEGLGALDEDSNHDVRIFSLAILLSSSFIYNSMGSIDENALSNLSLVINLTKNIHLKSNGLSEDTDPEEYSQYFPSFMWVVRDFSLLLVDQEGEAITSKEYFEKALQTQKGFSDGVEQKNRIRRLLKSFFKERDCCTMIRPLTKEENLQILEQMPLEELRPEFVDQVMQLRRKVINKIKPKMINGKKLNGEMLFNLSLSYVDAINKGAIPNIETAWSYICKSECQKAQYDAYDKFEKNFQENFEMQSPVFDDELKEIYSQAKKIALEEFGKVAVGEVQKQYLVELKDKLKAKYNQIRNENEKNAEQQCVFFLQNNYQTIERKLKNQEYQSIYDFHEELKNFQQYYMENGPPGPNRLTVLFEFSNKSQAEASEFFFRNIDNELHLQRMIGEEERQKLKAQLSEIKNEQKMKIETYETKLRNAETDKAELSAKEQSIKENLSQVQKDSQQLELETAEKLTSMKKEVVRQLEEYKNKIYQSEETIKEISRQRIAAESEFDKQKALLEQKLEFQEKSLADANKKEKELSNELNNIKRDHFNSNKDTNAKIENQIKDLSSRLEIQTELVFEWETKYQNIEQKYEQEREKWRDMESQLKKELLKTKTSFQELTNANENLKRKYVEETEQFKYHLDDEKSLSGVKIAELEQDLKNCQDSFDSSKLKWEKDQAISKQKMEFIELSLKEEKIKNEEQRQSHDQMIKSIQSRERDSVLGKEEAAQKVDELKLHYGQEYNELEQKFDQIRQRMQTQIDQLQERNSELDLSLKIQVSDFEKEIHSLREALTICEEQKSKAVDQVKNLDSQKLLLVEESEERHKLRHRDLEGELEEKTLYFEQQVTELEERLEGELVQLRTFYEAEKERLERRLVDDKERAQKRYNIMVEDYEQKLREEQTNHEDDVALEQNEKHQMETSMQSIINRLDHENSMKDQQIETLQKYLAETKESLQKIQSMSSLSMEQQLDKFNEERREMMEKIEKLTIELTRRERTVTALENQRETLNFQVQQKEKALAELRSEGSIDKTDLEEKIEQMRAKEQSNLDEWSQDKIHFERERALKQQQLQFQEQRITELIKQLDDTVKRYEERIKSDREDMQRDFQDKITRINADKEEYETKYNQKRKALKEQENMILKQTTLMEREKAVMEEKCMNMEIQQKDLVKNYETELFRLREQNEQLNMALSSDKQAIQEEVERWRREYSEMERQHSDLNNAYDKDKALYEGKFKFLEQQRDTAKRDFEDAQNKFQSTVEQLQKTQNESKNKAEAAYQTNLASQESKFNQRIREIQESQVQMIQELSQKNKQLERDNKLMNDRLELTSKSMQYEQGSLEKKLEKALENEAKLQEELDLIKAERDSKISEYQKMLDKEKENYKLKLREIEGKGTSVHSKQTEMMLNFEKERAKWDQEKTYLINQKDDASDNSQRMDKKVELLTRENEKLKNDLRTNRKSMYQATGNSGTYQSTVVGSKIIGSLNSYGLTKATDSAQKDRPPSGYQPKEIGSFNSNITHVDKSFSSFQGALVNISSALKNAQSSTSSNVSEYKSRSTLSPDCKIEN